MQRFREVIHIRTMKAKRKVEEISKEDVQTFLKKNAFVLFTVGAVIVGVYLPLSYTDAVCFSFESVQDFGTSLLCLQVSFWVLHCDPIR